MGSSLAMPYHDTDYISRLESGEPADSTYDDVPDVGLFSLTTVPTHTLYHKGSDDIWRRAVRQFEKPAILQEAHHDIVGGHYVGESTARKVW